MFTSILAAIGALGAIAGAITYMIKTGVWIFKKTPEQKDRQVDQQTETEEQSVDKGGRPKWD